MQNSANKDLTGAAQDLSKAQASVDQMSQSPPSGGLPSDSQQALQQASAALKDASIQAVQAQGAAAAAQGQKAEDAMQKAQAGLTQAMAQVQAKAQQGQGQMQGPKSFWTAAKWTDDGPKWSVPAVGPVRIEYLRTNVAGIRTQRDQRIGSRGRRTQAEGAQGPGPIPAGKSAAGIC